MSYGLTVYNSGSLIQIGEDYSNYYLSQEGTATIPSGTEEIQISINNPSGLQPLIAIKSSTYAVALRQNSTIGAFRRQFGTTASITFSYRIYLPSLNLSAPGERYGLVVKNSTGSIVFDSSRKQLRVLQLIGYTETARTPGVGPNKVEAPRYFSHSHGDKFIMHSQWPLRRGVMLTGDGQLMGFLLCAIKSSNNSVAVTDSLFRTDLPWTDNAYPRYDGRDQLYLAILGD